VTSIGGRELVTLTLPPETSGWTLRSQVAETRGVPPWRIRLLLCGALLDMDASLASLSLAEGDAVTYVLCSPGFVLTGNLSVAKLWSVCTGEHLATFAGHCGEIDSVALASDGHRAATGSDDGTARVWSTETFECLATLSGFCGGLAFSVNGLLVCGSDDGAIVKLFSEAYDCIATIKLPETNCHPATVAFSADGRIALGSLFGSSDEAWIVDGSTLEPLLWLPDGHFQDGGATAGHNRTVRALAFSPDGGLIATGGDDLTPKIWNAKLHADESNMEKPTWRSWPAGPWMRAECFGTLYGHTDTVNSIAFAPNGTVVTGSSDNTAKLWSAATHECVATLFGHGDSVSGVAVANDGRIVTCSSDGAAKIWSADANECLVTLCDGGELQCVAIVAEPWQGGDICCNE